MAKKWLTQEGSHDGAASGPVQSSLGSSLRFSSAFQIQGLWLFFFLIKSCPDSSGNNSHQINAQKEACLFVNRNCCPNDTLKTPNSWLLLQGHRSRSPLPSSWPSPPLPHRPLHSGQNLFPTCPQLSQVRSTLQLLSPPPKVLSAQSCPWLPLFIQVSGGRSLSERPALAA